MVVARSWWAGRSKTPGMEFQFCKMKSSRDWLHNRVNVLNGAELYTYNRFRCQILYNVYCKHFPTITNLKKHPC